MQSKTSNKNKTAVFTIVSKNYLHFARTLMESLKAVHPEWRRYVLLVDEVRGDFDPASESFEIIEVSKLALPEMKKFLFRYTILELNTAVKPWMFEWLFEEMRYDFVLYLDPDIYVYRRMSEVEDILSSGGMMVLTPHLTGQLDNNGRPDELQILISGSYNLGFLALARHESLYPFLHWWQSKLEHHCIIDFQRGYFVDQKWIDLVPGMFGKVAILRHEGYNVAYWNLNHRRLENSGKAILANSQPLVFLHFSGMNPEEPNTLSKYQDRFTLNDLPVFKDLAMRYCKKTIDNGLRTCENWQYAFGKFDDGAEIVDILRHCYRETEQVQEAAGENPFCRSECFNSPWGRGRKSQPLITCLMHFIWGTRRDIQTFFPDIKGRNRVDFARWYLNRGVAEYDIPEMYVAPVRNSLLESGLSEVPVSEHTGLGPVGKLIVKTVDAVGPTIVTKFPESLREWVKGEISYPMQTGSLTKPLLLDFDNPSHPFVVYKTDSSPKVGMNIIGYVRSEHGLGESPRRSAAAAKRVKIPFTVYDFNIGNSSRTQDETLSHKLRQDNPHMVNLIHINADQMPVLHSAVSQRFFEGHYNIGYWAWELPEFPDNWLTGFANLHEIWVPSTFVQESVAAKSPVPVIRMPHAVGFNIGKPISRKEMGLPERRFLFLCMYDLSSIQARKNPLAAIRAFREAFPNPHHVSLVVKTQNSQFHPESLNELKSHISDVPGIIHIDRTLTRQEVYHLEFLCDCFVSLHRSEGFGLGLAEAMFLQRPAIGTNWSGNTDFMNHMNSCPVHYELVELEKDYGPYNKGQYWAEADIDHAAWYMKKLVNYPEWKKNIAVEGQQTILTHFSPEAVGKMYQKRLRLIPQWWSK